MNFQILRPEDQVTQQTREMIAAFLFDHLDEYGDTMADIHACLDYTFSTEAGKGGLAVLAWHNNTLQGAVLLNATGMQGYVPELLLVYIAVHREARGQGLGQQLMEQVLTNTTGSIALHVEATNPARRLYERMGFTNPYLEMRYKRS
jgi:GNAT superfamily N-acetyltransferase